MCRVEKGPSQQGPPHRGASGSDGQTSHTCLEVSEELCWGPGEISVLGVLPGLAMRLPEGGQDRGRTDVAQALPKAVLALVNQSSNQSHNSIPSSERSGSQIRPWKSDSMWTIQLGRLFNPHPHLQPRIAGRPFRVNTTRLLFIFSSLEHIKITLPDPNIHVSTQKLGLNIFACQDQSNPTCGC